MSRETIGKLKPVYSFLLNPHADTRLSRCPHCNKLTYPRKFGLLIHVLDWGPMVQGKTCKYCSKCKLILVQQDELEEELRHSFEQRDPRVLGKEYMVLGVLELKTFKKGLHGEPRSLEETLEHISEFKKHYDLAYSPGGWYAPGQEPRVLSAHREQRIPR